jgi:integrase
LVPLAPEAVELPTPLQRDRGFVFAPLRQDGEPMARDTYNEGKMITAIGAKAGVVVNPECGKCRSAHDLRRAFDQRWAKRLMPA